MNNYYQEIFENQIKDFDPDKRTPDDYPMWYLAVLNLIYHLAPGGAMDAIKDIVGRDRYDEVIDFLESFQSPETCLLCGQEIKDD